MWMAVGIFAAAALCFCLRSEYEKKHFSVERTEIQSPKIKKDCRLVFLSDLHNNQFGKDNDLLIREIIKLKPDLIVTGGDLMVCRGEGKIEVPLSLMKRLTEKFPVFCGNGNHENRMKRQREVYGDLYQRYTAALKEMGAEVLEDESRLWGDFVTITGIDLERKYYKKFTSVPMPAAELEKKAGKPQESRFQILLLHSPMHFEAARQWGADLVLSGHFHGGTIRLPFLGGVMTPQFQFFLPWAGGTFKEEGRTMIVSRGLGTHSINIRFNNKPQVVVVDLKKPPGNNVYRSR